MKHLTSYEARATGAVLEVNRQLLHPRGLALEITVPKDDDEPVYHLAFTKDALEALAKLNALGRASSELAEAGWTEEWFDTLAERIGDALVKPNEAVLRLQDHRDDPEGVIFSGLPAEETTRAHDAFEAAVLPAREGSLGYVVQPFETTIA